MWTATRNTWEIWHSAISIRPFFVLLCDILLTGGLLKVEEDNCKVETTPSSSYLCQQEDLSNKDVTI